MREDNFYRKRKELKERIDSLEKTVKLQEKRNSKFHKTKQGNNITNVIIELMSFTISSLLLGYFLDKYLETTPIMIIICMLFGYISAMKFIWNKYSKNSLN